LYLISGQAFSFSEFSVRGKLVVDGNAAATAQNILANETLYRLGFAAELLLFYLVVTFILYDLLNPVNRSLSQLAYVFSVVGCTISALNCLIHFAPLVVLGGSSTAFTPDQLKALALMSNRPWAWIAAIFLFALIWAVVVRKELPVQLLHVRAQVTSALNAL